jgi:two-component system sensor histidine kinase KdpD
VRREGQWAAWVVVFVGPGISGVGLALVFHRFWRGRDQERQGTGLGLAIAAAIVARHGGLIMASNRPQGGASFRLTMPILEAARAPGSRPGAPQGSSPEVRMGP